MARLDPVALRYLVERRLLIPAAGAIVQPDTTGAPWRLMGASAALEQFRRVIGWPPEVMGAFSAVLRGPYEDEVSELGFVDAFYAIPPEVRLPAAPSSVLLISERVVSPQDPSALKDFPYMTSQFFYPPPVGIPPSGRFTYWSGPNAPRDRVQYWALDTSKPWGDVRGPMVSALVAERAMSSYPWPSPSNHVQVFWTKRFGDQFRRLILASPGAREGDVRTAITLSIIQNYATILADVQEFMQAKEEKAAKMALFRMIAMGAVGLILIAVPGIPALLSTTVQSAMSSAGSAARAGAAGDMEKAAKQFAATDAAFAAEVDRVAEELDPVAAAHARGMPYTKEELAALMEEDGAYRVFVENRNVGVADTPDGASRLAAEKSVPGNRIRVFFKGSPAGVYVRTERDIVPVDPAQEDAVFGFSPGTMRDIAGEADPGLGIPGWIVPAAGLVIAGVQSFGKHRGRRN